jgi:hypothetical protein
MAKHADISWTVTVRWGAVTENYLISAANKHLAGRKALRIAGSAVTIVDIARFQGASRFVEPVLPLDSAVL